MKAFLIISLFILISSKDNAIEFAKEIPFDNNNENLNSHMIKMIIFL